MSTTALNFQPSLSNAQSVSFSTSLFKSTDGDISWRWNSLEDTNNRRRVTCSFCKSVSTVEISRAKQYELGIKENIIACTQTFGEVKLFLKENEEKRLVVKIISFYVRFMKMMMRRLNFKKYIGFEVEKDSFKREVLEMSRRV